MAGTENILEAANRLTSGERREQYGSVRREAEQVAALWSAYLGDKLQMDIAPEDYAPMMMLLKLSRFRHRQGRDDLVDACGYARCAELLTEDEPPIWEKLVESSDRMVKGIIANELQSLAEKRLQHADAPDAGVWEGEAEALKPKEKTSDVVHKEFAEGYEKLASATSDLVEKSRAKKHEAEPFDEDVFQEASKFMRKGRFGGFLKRLSEVSIEKAKEEGTYVEPEAPKEEHKECCDSEKLPTPSIVVSDENKKALSFNPSNIRNISESHVLSAPVIDTHGSQQYIGMAMAINEPHLDLVPGMDSIREEMNQRAQAARENFELHMPATPVIVDGRTIEIPWEVKRFACDLNQGLYVETVIAGLFYGLRNRIHSVLQKTNMLHTPALWLNQAIFVEAILGLKKEPPTINKDFGDYAMFFDSHTRNAIMTGHQFNDANVAYSLALQAIERAEAALKSPSDKFLKDRKIDPVVEQVLERVAEKEEPANKVSEGRDGQILWTNGKGWGDPVLEGVCVGTGKVQQAQVTCGHCKRCMCSKCEKWHNETKCRPLTWNDRDAIKSEIEYYASRSVKAIEKELEDEFDPISEPMITKVFSRHTAADIEKEAEVAREYIQGS